MSRIAVLIVALAAAGAAAWAGADPDAAARRAMVEHQIKARGISDERVLRAELTDHDRVYTIEIIEPLVQSAARRLRDLGPRAATAGPPTEGRRAGGEGSSRVAAASREPDNRGRPHIGTGYDCSGRPQLPPEVKPLCNHRSQSY